MEGVPDDRIECEHCGRKFAAVPAERHIPLCAQKAHERKMKTKKPQQVKTNTTNKRPGNGFNASRK